MHQEPLVPCVLVACVRACACVCALNPADVGSLYAFFYRPDFARDADNNPFADAEVRVCSERPVTRARVELLTRPCRVIWSSDLRFGSCTTRPTK